MEAMAYNEIQMRALDRYRLVFCEQLDHELMLEYLVAAGCFKEHHVDLVKGEKSKFLQRAKLLTLIKQRGPTAFSVFVQALLSDTVDQSHLADLIKDYDHNVTISAISGNHPLAIESRQRNSSGDQSGDEYPPNDPNRYPLNKKHTFYISSPSQVLTPEQIEQENKKNEEFYAAELRAYTNVPETEGVMENLEVLDISDGNTATKMYEEQIDDIYPHFSKPKGLAIVFNNQDFEPQADLPRRQGTEVDKKNIVRLLQGLGYSVKVKENLTAQGMTKAMVSFALKSEHNDCHSAVVVILSHGLQGQIYGTDGNLINIERFLSFLNSSNCSALKNKPKLVFIQACRGERYDAGHVLGNGRDAHDGNVNGNATALADIPVDELIVKLNAFDMIDANYMKKVPTEADFMIAYATTPGYVSWRNSMHGSWFIQAICQVFTQYAKEWDIARMMIKVNSIVASKFSSTGHVQVPEPHIRLLKQFYFFPGVSSGNKETSI